MWRRHQLEEDEDRRGYINDRRHSQSERAPTHDQRSREYYESSVPSAYQWNHQQYTDGRQSEWSSNDRFTHDELNYSDRGVYNQPRSPSRVPRDQYYPETQRRGPYREEERRGPYREEERLSHSEYPQERYFEERPPHVNSEYHREHTQKAYGYYDQHGQYSSRNPDKNSCDYYNQPREYSSQIPERNSRCTVRNDPYHRKEAFSHRTDEQYPDHRGDSFSGREGYSYSDVREDRNRRDNGGTSWKHRHKHKRDDSRSPRQSREHYSERHVTRSDSAEVDQTVKDEKNVKLKLDGVKVSETVLKEESKPIKSDIKCTKIDASAIKDSKEWGLPDVKISVTTVDTDSIKNEYDCKVDLSSEQHNSVNDSIKSLDSDCTKAEHDRKTNVSFKQRKSLSKSSLLPSKKVDLEKSENAGVGKECLVLERLPYRTEIRSKTTKVSKNSVVKENSSLGGNHRETEMENEEDKNLFSRMNARYKGKPTDEEKKLSELKTFESSMNKASTLDQNPKLILFDKQQSASEVKEGRKCTSSSSSNSYKSRHNIIILSQSSESENSGKSEQSYKRKLCKRKACKSQKDKDSKNSQKDKDNKAASKSYYKRERDARVCNVSNRSDSDTSSSDDFNSDQSCRSITDGDSEKHHGKERGLRQIDGKWYWKATEIKFPHVVINKMNIEKEHSHTKTRSKISKSMRKFRRIKQVVNSSSDSTNALHSNGENEKNDEPSIPIETESPAKSRSGIGVITGEDSSNRNALEFLSSMTGNALNVSEVNYSQSKIQNDTIAENEISNASIVKRQNSGSFHSHSSSKEKRSDSIDSDTSTKSENSLSTAAEEELLYGEADENIDCPDRAPHASDEERTKVKETSEINRSENGSLNIQDSFGQQNSDAFSRKEHNVMLVAKETSASKETAADSLNSVTTLRSEGSVTTEGNAGSQNELDCANVEKPDCQNITSFSSKTNGNSIAVYREKGNKKNVTTEEIDSDKGSSEVLLHFDYGKKDEPYNIPVSKKKNSSREMQPVSVDSDMSTRSESSVTTQVVPVSKKTFSSRKLQPDSVDSDMSTRSENSVTTQVDEDLQNDCDLDNIEKPGGIEMLSHPSGQNRKCFDKEKENASVGTKDSSMHARNSGDEDLPIIPRPKSLRDSRWKRTTKSSTIRAKRTPIHINIDDDGSGEEGDIEDNDRMICDSDNSEDEKVGEYCKEKQKPTCTIKDESSEGKDVKNTCAVKFDGKEEIKPNISLECKQESEHKLSVNADDKMNVETVSHKTETGIAVKSEPEWSSQGYTQQDVIFLSDDSDVMTMSYSLPPINVDTDDSDGSVISRLLKIKEEVTSTSVIKDPEFYEFYSSHEDDSKSDECNDSDRDIFVTQSNIQPVRENVVDKTNNEINSDISISSDERPLRADKSNDLNKETNNKTTSAENVVNKEFDSDDDLVLNESMKLYEELCDISATAKNVSLNKDSKLMPSKLISICESQEATQLYSSKLLQDDNQSKATSGNKGNVAIVKKVGFCLEEPKRNNLVMSNDNDSINENPYLQNTQADVDCIDISISDSDISVLEFYSEHFPNCSEDEHETNILQQRSSKNEDEQAEQKYIENQGKETIMSVDRTRAVELQRTNMDQDAEMCGQDEIEFDPVYGVETQKVDGLAKDMQKQMHSENDSDFSDKDPQLESYFVETQQMPGASLNHAKGQMFVKLGLHLNEHVSDDDNTSDLDYPYDAQTQIDYDIEERNNLNNEDTARLDEMADDSDNAFNAMTQVNYITNINENDDDDCHKSDSDESQAEPYMLATQLDPWSVDRSDEAKFPENIRRETPGTRYVAQGEQIDRNILTSDQAFDALTQRDNEVNDIDGISDEPSKEQNVNIIKDLNDDYICATQVDKCLEMTTSGTEDELGYLHSGEFKAFLPGMHQDGGRKRHQSYDESQMSPCKKSKPSIARRKTISIEPQKLKSTAEKRLSHNSLLQTTITGPKSADTLKNKLKNDNEKGVLKEKETNLWLSKKEGKQDINKDKNCKRKRRQRKEDPSIALKAHMQEARCQLTERNFISRVKPDTMANSSKRANPSATATTSYLEDVDLPSDSQIVREGLPVLNPTGILVKRRGSSTATHQPDRFVSRTAGLTDTILSSNDGKTCRSTSTKSTTTVTIATTSQSTVPFTSHMHTSTVVSVTSISSVRTLVKDVSSSSSHVKRSNSTENRSEKAEPKKKMYGDSERPVKKVKFSEDHKHLSDYEVSHQPTDRASVDKHKKEHSSVKKHSVYQSSKSDKKGSGEVVEKHRSSSSSSKGNNKHTEENTSEKLGSDKKKKEKREVEKRLKEQKVTTDSAKEKHSSRESKAGEKLPKDHGKYSDKREKHSDNKEKHRFDKEKHAGKRSKDRHSSGSKKSEHKHSENKHTSGRSEEKAGHEETEGSNKSVSRDNSSSAADGRILPKNVTKKEKEKEKLEGIKSKSTSERNDKQMETGGKHHKDNHISEGKENLKKIEEGPLLSRKESAKCERHRSRSTSKETEKSSKTSGKLTSEKGKSGTKDQDPSERVQTDSRTKDKYSVERTKDKHTVERTKDKHSVERTKDKHTVERTKDKHSVERTKDKHSVERTKDKHSVERTKDKHSVERTKDKHTVERTKDKHTVERTKDKHTVERTKDKHTVERKTSVEEHVKPKKDDISGRRQEQTGAKREGMHEKPDIKNIPSEYKSQPCSGTKTGIDRKCTDSGTKYISGTKEGREKVSKERDMQSNVCKKTSRQPSSCGIETREHSSSGQTGHIEEYKIKEVQNPGRETQHKVSVDNDKSGKHSDGKENNVSGRSPAERDHTRNQHRDKHQVNRGETVKPSTSAMPVRTSAMQQKPTTSHKSATSLMIKQSYRPEPLRDIQLEPLRIFPTGARQRPETIQQRNVDKPTFSFNEFIAVILKWNHLWFQEKEEQEKVPNKKGPVAPPPVANGWFGRPTLLPLVGSYSGGYQEYSKTFMVPLLLHETWEGCYKTWRDKKANKQLHIDSLIFGGESVIQERFMFYTLQGLVSERRLRNGQYMMEGDLIKLKLHGKLLKEKGVEQDDTQTIMGFVMRTWLRDTSVDRICAHNSELAKQRTAGCVSIKLQVRVGRRRFTPSDQKLIQAESVSSLVTVTRQFSSLLALSNNQLCADLLCPDSNSLTYWDSAPPTPEKLRGRYNESQSIAINTAARMIRLPPTTPRICLIQGPPGTGKSKTIIGIINRIIKDLNGRCRICVCAPSNSAVDELLRRIHKQNNDKSQKDFKHSIPFVRLGKKSSIHSDLQCKSLDSLVEEAAQEAARKEQLQKIPDSLQVQKLRLEKQINMVAEKRIATKDEFQRRKLKIDLEKLKKQKEVLEEKCRPNLGHVQIDKSTEFRLQTEILTKSQVVSATLSGMGHKSIKAFISGLGRTAGPKDRPVFDCVIVDEATQAVELDTWIPLQYGTTKLILVGDPEQLPPTVLSQVAQEHQFHRSLFERLDSHFRSSERNPVILLNVQYRMDPEIVSFPNRYVYDGKIQNDACVSKQKHFPLVPYLLYNIHEGQEHFSQSCQFEPLRRSLSNALEAHFTAELCRLIVDETKVIEQVIGIIAPYSRQKKEIKEHLNRRNLVGIEVSTVDGFQGREKHVIIMSCVRANMSGSIGFVGNRNRMNVSLTRAKFGMFLVGHFDALESSSDEWKSLIEDGRSRDKIVDVDERSLQQALKRCLR